MCDNGDVEDVAPIEGYLFNEGFNVINSALSFEGSDASHWHRDSLLTCHAALIYYGKAPEMWLRAKLSDVEKARAWGRTSPLAAKAVYVGGEATPRKQGFRMPGVPLVIHDFEGFTPDTIRPFVQAARAGQGGAL